MFWVWLACTGEPPPVVEAACDELPSAPFEMRSVPGTANEDLTFDADGFLVGADNAKTLWRTDLDGTMSMVLPNSGVDAGLRSMWWDGTLASVQYTTSTLYRIDPNTGSKEPLVGALQTPSGIEIGLDHSVWIGELNGDRVQRFDVDTGMLHVIAEGLGRPNGLTFNETYDRLYVAATDESRIYRIDIDPDTLEPVGLPRVFVDDAGAGIDGLSVDACGNVYAAWWSLARIERWDSEGGNHELVVFEPGVDYALGNFAWGPEAFGWSPTTIYIVEQGPATIRSLDLGVREKPRPSR